MRGQSAGEADLREHALYIWRVYMYGLNVLQLLTHECVFAVARIWKRRNSARRTWKRRTSGMFDMSGVVMVVLGRRWCRWGGTLVRNRECGWVGIRRVGGWDVG